MHDPDAPAWFSTAIGTRPEDRTVRVKACDIHYLRWGDVERPGIVLVHGGAAHAHWWSFIAPLLLPHHHVVALDLSGHGESGHRPVYTVETWADEVMACAQDSGMRRPPVLVGHSMGGLVTIAAASLHGEKLAGAVVVDSPVRRPDPESEEGERGRMFRNPKVYGDLETALQHFHLAPPQPCDNQFIVDFIARRSLHEVEGGWTWKFDPKVFLRDRRGIDDYLADIHCRLAVFKGQHSDLVTADVQDYMDELLGRSSPIVEIPAAYHHVPLDQPLALVAALRAILADWEHSVPTKRPPEAIAAHQGTWSIDYEIREDADSMFIPAHLLPHARTGDLVEMRSVQPAVIRRGRVADRLDDESRGEFVMVRFD